MNIVKNFEKINLPSLFTKNNLVSFVVITIIFLLDRISKNKIINSELIENNLYVNNFLNFDLTWNTGIGFGFFSSNSQMIYNSITFFIGIVIIAIFFMLLKSKLIDKLLFALILGGALGNFYDRITYFAVPDFIDFHYQNFHWFTFNIADISISIGVIMLISKELFFKNDKN
tara:strand:+ start:1236 stop:1751 length:516 start_codon:yes stop_codon:yes gene_type:complete